MNRIVIAADFQGCAMEVSPDMLPDGDILICPGDLTSMGTIGELAIFDTWLGNVKHKYKHVIYTAGNHDLGLARGINGHSFFQNGTYVEDELIEIEGLKIYGSPLNDCGPYAQYWEFCSPRYVKSAIEAIPGGIDILVTHGCPKGILDHTPSGENIGSVDLLVKVMEIKPKAHLFGHAHSGTGIFSNGDTLFVNGALCDEMNNILDDNGALLKEVQVIDI